MKTKRTLLWGIAILALSLSVVSTGVLLASSTFGNTDKHLLYIGTNDKDTLQAELSIEEAQTAISAVCTKYAIDYTLAEVDGVWTNTEKETTTEDTFVLILYGASNETVSTICTDLLSVLNQETILIERSRVKTQFFSG
ncbi:hypothetical protein LJC56_01840 [Christensenellaceae bacterium OttesenSCG-928-K19]|nr:hypothetical protein [Christensenellaceae bacterium OttesenSCG-928-K19]